MLALLAFAALAQTDTLTLNQQELERITQRALPTRHSVPVIVGGKMEEWDYPPRSLANEEQGSVRVSFVVTIHGRAHDCRIERSSGYPALDEASCRIVNTRYRLHPARTPNGNPVETRANQNIVCRLP